MIRPGVERGLFAFAALVLVAVALVMNGRGPTPSDFVVTPAIAVPPVARMDFVPQPPSGGVNHAPTAVTLADGRIELIWFSGSREGASDVVLKASIFDGQSWGLPRIIMDATDTGRDQHRFIRALGNPVVFRRPDGEYWLVYVSVTIGGWSTSALNLRRSADGIAWGSAQRLVTSPFLNLSTLVKGPPLFLSDGLVALPVYDELITTFPELLMIDRDGAVVDRIRMGDTCQIQPWAVATAPRAAVALMRQHGCADPNLWLTATGDGGLSWRPPTPTPFGNPDSPAAVSPLPGGRLVAVLNDGNPAVLSLALSDDGGASWRKGPAVFDGTSGGLTYRYPWILQDAGGRIHVFASESSLAIREAVLGAADLDAPP